MTFGRPAAIPADYIRHQLPQDFDDTLQDTLTTDPRKGLSVGFYNATM